MVAPLLRTIEHGEPKIRLRKGIFGKLIVQVRYSLLIEKHSFPARDGTKEGEARGMGKWRDANTGNLKETIDIVKKLNCCVK